MKNLIINSIKKVLKSTLVILIVSTSIHAQNNSTDKEKNEAFKKMKPEERARILTDSLQKYIVLNQTQSENVFKINLFYANKIQDVLQKDESKYSKYFAIKSLDSQRDEELKTQLSEAQFRKYKSIKDSIIEKIKNRY